MNSSPLQFLAASIVHLGIVLTPAYLCAAVKRSKPITKAVSLTLILYIMQNAILACPNFAQLAALKMNWVQKGIAFLVTLLCIFVLKLKKSECGLGKPSSYKGFLIAILLGVLCTIPSLLSDYFSNEFSKPTVEYFLFELFMPGLQEEPLFRGLLLAVWDKEVGRPYQLFGVKAGWGALVSLTLFSLGHLCFFDRNFHLHFTPEILPWLDLIIFSTAMTWLRYKFKSVWPCVVAHNLGNSLETVIAPLISSMKP